MENLDVHNVAELMSEGDENRQIEKNMTQRIPNRISTRIHYYHHVHPLRTLAHVTSKKRVSDDGWESGLTFLRAFSCSILYPMGCRI